MTSSTKTVTFRTLVPDEGMWLTQANLAEGAERSFSKSVSQPESASPDEWTEVDDEYKASWEAEHQAAAEEEA